MTAHAEIEFDREEDGRWIAEAIETPGVLAYGATKKEARLKAELLTRQVIVERFSSETTPCRRRRTKETL